MSDFDERSGIVGCETEWGQWWQTMEEVFLEVNVAEGTKAKDIKCEFKPSSLRVVVRGETLIEGTLTDKIHSSDSIWTLEDRKLLRICLPKALKTASQCWRSLLSGQYKADPLTYDQMEQKMTLQRFQMENPGMDFSGASISGNYHEGGPKMDPS